MSVAKCTLGKWSYLLPKRPPRKLSLVPSTAAELPFQVLENAHWRPQAAKLQPEMKRKLASAPAGTPHQGSAQRLWTAWRREETWINHSLSAVLSGIPDRSLGSLMRDLTGLEAWESPHLAKLDSGGLSGLTGDPDFIVSSADSSVLGESKVAAHAKSHRYSFEQFTKYQFLGSLLECARDPALRRSVAHLVLVPDPEPGRFSSDYKMWRPGVQDGRLIADLGDRTLIDQAERFSDLGSWREFLRRTLLDRRTQLSCEVDPERVVSLFRRNPGMPIPTFVVSWEALMVNVRSIAAELRLGNLDRATCRLESMAYGRDPDRDEAARADKFVAKSVVWMTPGAKRP